MNFCAAQPLWIYPRRMAVKFLAVFGVCYAVRFGVLTLLVKVLLLSASLSQVISMAFYTLASYFLSRWFVYGESSEKTERDNSVL
jgi:putative flippase GtrA